MLLNILNQLRVFKRDLIISFEALRIHSFVYYWLMKFLPFGTTLHLKIRKKDIGVWVRKKNKIDIDVIHYVFVQKFHIPPIRLPEKPIIVDLGSNIGLTILDYHNTYKESMIYGYELDRGNYNLAKLNCDNIKNIHLFNKAVWLHDHGVYYNSDVNSDAYSVDSDSGSKDKLNYIESVTISKIMESNNIDFIHYLKMDIEGAEKQIFFDANLDWLDRILSLNIEMHNFSDQEIDRLLVLLQLKKFTAWKDTYHWNSVMAYKNI